MHSLQAPANCVQLQHRHKPKCRSCCDVHPTPGLAKPLQAQSRNAPLSLQPISSTHHQQQRRLGISHAQKEGSSPAPLSHTSSTGGQHSTPGQTPLMCSLQLTWSRAKETARAQEGSEAAEQDVLLLDQHAQALLQHLNMESESACDELTHLIHVLASRYIDDTLLSAMEATNVNSVNKGDYRQVVLVGDALDSRPYRLPWPEGTLIFVVADRESHEKAAAAYKAIGARVPRGCLLKRVPAVFSHHQVAGSANMEEDLPSFLPALETAGYQGNKLSVWALQGCAGQGLTPPEVQQLFTDVTNAAAFNSLVLGEMPRSMTRRAAENILADGGLLSTVLGYDQDATSCGRWTTEHSQQLISKHSSAGSVDSVDVAGLALPWLFTSQQLRLSLQEMGIYEAHVAAAEETDEDFFGNFS